MNWKTTFLALMATLFLTTFATGQEPNTEADIEIFNQIMTDNEWRTPRFPLPVEDTDYYDNGAPDPAIVELGRILFYDKVLSGNLNISCASCHHPFAATADGLSLSIGEGGEGFAVTRTTGPGASEVPERVPRNAPAVFNLGAHEFSRMFHDGRVELMPSHPSGFATPAGDDLPQGLDNVLAAQAMFPVTSGTEMAGQAGENAQADAGASQNLPELWTLIADKLRSYPEYVDMFIEAYQYHPTNPVTSASDITYVHAANAIAAFEATVWRSDNSPFDSFLRGDRYAMSPRALLGALRFYGSANCSTCHAGVFQTDHQFHAIAMPQVGPGKGDGFDGHDDFGRERVTGDEADRYRFRTPTLRNVALTGPWGHDGAFATLEGAVRHHLDAVESLENYDPNQLVLPHRNDLDEQDLMAFNDPTRRAALAAANELPPSNLNDREVAELIEFLYSLTDPRALDLRADVPETVPSGLPVRD